MQNLLVLDGLDQLKGQIIVKEKVKSNLNLSQTLASNLFYQNISLEALFSFSRFNKFKQINSFKFFVKG